MKAHGFNMEGPFKGELLTTLPAWTSDDEGREIYTEDTQKRYYADATAWVEYALDADVDLNTAHRETISGNPHQVTLEEARAEDNELAGDIDFDNNDIVDIKGIGFQDGQEVTWNPDDFTINVPTGLGPILQVGQESYVKVYNNTGSTLEDGVVVYANDIRPSGVLGVARALADTHTTIIGELIV